MQSHTKTAWFWICADADGKHEGLIEQTGENHVANSVGNRKQTCLKTLWKQIENREETNWAKQVSRKCGKHVVKM